MAVKVGTRLNDWNTKPIRSRRSLVSPASSSPWISSSPTNTWPEVGGSRPAMQCIRVDLPDPDGPITAVNFARSKATVTPARASTRALAGAVGLDQVDGPGRGRRRVGAAGRSRR